MPTQSVQTINESVQAGKNRASNSSNCFSSLGRSSAESHIKMKNTYFDVF